MEIHYFIDNNKTYVDAYSYMKAINHCKYILQTKTKFYILPAQEEDIDQNKLYKLCCNDSYQSPSFQGLINAFERDDKIYLVCCEKTIRPIDIELNPKSHKNKKTITTSNRYHHDLSVSETQKMLHAMFLKEKNVNNSFTWIEKELIEEGWIEEAIRIYQEYLFEKPIITTIINKIDEINKMHPDKEKKVKSLGE
jgi:hypothetical protein